MLHINYLKVKKVLLKRFKNEQVYIEIKGEFNTRFWIEKSRILINKNKLIIANENQECIIYLDFIKKVKIQNQLRIELFGLQAKYILEI